jgi:hypothetical protein
MSDLQAADDILRPVMEAAIVLASSYAASTGRDSITAMDVRYGLMYACRNVTGKQLGSIYPEIYDEEDEEEDEEEEDEEDEEPFARYQGEEELYVKMNECADTWEAWEPSSPMEAIMKRSVDKISL